MLERAITLAESDIIAAEHLGLPEVEASLSEPSYCDQSQSTTDPTSQTTPLSNSVAAAEDSLPTGNPQKDTKASVSAAMQESASAELPEKGLEAYLQQQEKQLIVTALQQTGWNKTQAAELLGTTFRSLRYRMKKLGIAEEQTDS